MTTAMTRQERRLPRKHIVNAIFAALDSMPSRVDDTNLVGSRIGESGYELVEMRDGATFVVTVREVAA